MTLSNKTRSVRQGGLDSETLHPPVFKTTVGLVVVTALFLTSSFHTAASISRSSFPDAADIYYLPSSKTLKAMSLGHREALADLIWLEALLYFGDKVKGDRRYEYLWRFLDTTLDLDPFHRRVYLWAGAVSMYNLNRIDNEAVRRSIHYLERGHQAFPKDWQILFSLASNYLHELHSTDPKQEAQWRRIGADYLWKAADIGGGPSYLHSLAAKVWSEQGRWEVAYRRLRAVYLSTDNPKIRESVRRRMVQLLFTGSDQVLTAERIAIRTMLAGIGPLYPATTWFLEAAHQIRVNSRISKRVEQTAAHRKSFEAAWKKDMPYVPLDLYVLLAQPGTDGPSPCSSTTSSPRSPSIHAQSPHQDMPSRQP